MSTSGFDKFAVLVQQQFQRITEAKTVFLAGIAVDSLYEVYIKAFPGGTNPIFKKSTEHDCSCCKHFIRRVGTVVSLKGGSLTTVWDTAAQKAPYPYNEVAKTLQEVIKHVGIKSLFLTNAKETQFGAKTTRSLDADGKALTWEHFFTGPLPGHLVSPHPEQAVGEYNTTVEVFSRGLKELTPEAVSTVLSLIDGNNLYRGEEHKAAVMQFQVAQAAYRNLPLTAQHMFVWENAHGPACRFRNTVIGTLVQDLSEGMDVEKAVAAFEKKVAPENYKRTSAVVTPGMIKKAMETVRELDLESALERRFATLADISVQDVLWVNGDVRTSMKGGLEGLLLEHAASVAKPDFQADEKRAEDVRVEDFLKTVLPAASSMELLFQGPHLSNLMSLTAPVHPEPKQLFRWNNDFAWSYAGNMADSYLRKQVQAKGGRVDGVLRFSHMWNHEKRNTSLMDLHVFLPGSSEHRDGCHDIYPSGPRVGWNRRNDGPSGGVQDVDYTSAAPEGYVPVENTTFPSMSRLKEGKYRFKIHNWQLRHPTLGGFRAEIEFGGKVYQYDHPEPLKNKEWITLAEVTLKDGVFTIEHSHPVGTASQQQWGLQTEKYTKVNAVTLSPNFWGDNRVGNKHFFFVLDGANNEEPTRGIYNEFLHSRLEQHRKVFELIGEKTKCQPTPGQLSGLGFSSTKKDSVLVKVYQGKKQRLFRVNFGA